MSDAPNPQTTYKKRDGTPYVPRAPKYPKPEEATDDVSKKLFTLMHEAYYFLDGILASGYFDIAEYDRIVYTLWLIKSQEAFEQLVALIKTSDYSKIKPFLDTFGIPDEPPIPEDDMDFEKEPPKKQHSRLRKENFVQQQAKVVEVSDEDNIESEPEDSESVEEEVRAHEREQKKKQEKKKKRDPPTQDDSSKAKKTANVPEREQRIIDLAEKLKSSSLSYQKIEKTNCKTTDCTNKQTPWFKDGMCGTCRSKNKKKHERKRKGLIKALEKQLSEKQKEVQERSKLLQRKHGLETQLEEISEAIGSESSDDDVSDTEETN